MEKFTPIFPLPNAHASFRDKLLLLPNLILLLVYILQTLISYPFAPAPKPKSFAKAAVYAAVRGLLRINNFAQNVWIDSTTIAVYLGFSRLNGFKPQITKINDDLDILWLGPKEARKTLLYFHGGGYVNCASTFHMKWLLDLQKRLSATTPINVAVVRYTLIPHKMYPYQITQAAQATNWLTDIHGLRPRDVIIAGDSAGGHMALSLLSHIAHPHPECPLVQIKEPLAAAVLISPWVSFATNTKSWGLFHGNDVIHHTGVQRAGSYFIGSKPQDAYNQPVNASADWFKAFNAAVGDVLIWAGAQEVLIDSIDKMVATMQQAFPHVEYVRGAGAAHIEPIFDTYLTLKKSKDNVLIENWLAKKLLEISG